MKSRWGKMWCQFIVPSLDFRSSFLLFLFSLIISHLLDTLAWKLTRFWVVFRRFSLFVSISKITLRLKVVVWFKYKVVFALCSIGYSYRPEKDVCTSLFKTGQTLWTLWLIADDSWPVGHLLWLIWSLINGDLDKVIYVTINTS